MQFNKAIFLILVPLLFMSHVAISMDDDVHSSDSTESHSYHEKDGQKKKQSGLSCQWGRCSKKFQGTSAQEDRYNHWVKEHLSRITRGTKLVVCKWKECGQEKRVHTRAKEWLMEHCSKKHLEYKPFLCETCGGRFQRRRTLGTHQSKFGHKVSVEVTEGEKFSCSYDECAKSPIEFTSQKKCWHHIQDHHFCTKKDADYKPVYPDVTKCHWIDCEYTIDTKLQSGKKKTRLLSHIQMEHLKNFQAYECDFSGCGKQYFTVGSLRSHRKTHEKNNKSTSRDDGDTSEDEPDSELSDESDLSAYEPPSENSRATRSRPITRQKRKLAERDLPATMEGSELHKAKKQKKSKNSRDADKGSSASLPIDLDDCQSPVQAEVQDIINESASIEPSHIPATQTVTTEQQTEEATPLATNAGPFCGWNGCWQEFKTEQALENHFFECHLLVCEICSEGPFATEKAMSGHVAKNH